MDIHFSGYQENVLTFECSGTLKPGDMVKMTAAGVVGKAAADDVFIGKCVSVNNDYAAVQLDGYTEAKRNGTIGLGYNKLVAAADGVKTGEGGIDRLVIYGNESVVGFIL